MIRRLFIASVLAAVVALPLAATMTTPASAATSLPDPSRLASLTVIDTAVSSGGVAETPVTGAGYMLERVLPVDLTSRAGWSAAAALAAEIDTTSIATAKASIAAAGRTLSAAGAATTDASGRATFAGLPLGLYLIEPVSAPSGSTLPAPSLIALPQTDPSNGSQWLYDVVVHPKSGATTITKTVADDTSTGPGARVTWTVLAGIPRPTSPGRPLAGYLLVDRLDTRLAYRGATVALRDPGTGARTPVPAADYTITTQRSGGADTLQLRFVGAGLALLAAHAGQQVELAIATTVTGTGDIPNSATVYPDDPETECPVVAETAAWLRPTTGAVIIATVAEHGQRRLAHTAAEVAPSAPAAMPPGCPEPVTSASVDTKWGAVRVTKTGVGATTLAGARFAVYLSGADARADRNRVAASGVTGADGVAVISGLRVSDYADGHQVGPGQPGYIRYWLAETTAPAGYERQTQPVAFTVDDADTAHVARIGIVDLPSAATQPGPSTPPAVPHRLAITGTDALPLSVVGVALACGGVLLILARRRRRSPSAREQ